MADQNLYDSVAGDLLDWLQSESKWYADQMRSGSGKSPFAAETSEKEKLDYYRRQMYQVKPDGTVQYDKPNAQGRQALMQRVGIDGYTQIYNTVKPPGPGRREITDPEPVPEHPVPEGY